MKILLTLFVLLFSSSVVAEDISDFQIEGMSIGDSLLDYFSEDEIKENIRKNAYRYKTDKKFTSLEFSGSFFEVYEDVQISYKTSDKNFKIYYLAGLLFFDNMKNCYKQKNEIVDDLSQLLLNASKIDKGTIKHPSDDSGKSTVNKVVFYFKSLDIIAVKCTDWSDAMYSKYSWVDNLRVVLKTKEFDDWITR